MDVLYIFLKQLTCEFQIYYLFCKIFEFRDFVDNNIFHKSDKSVHGIRQFKIFAKAIAYSRSPDHMLQKFILNIHILKVYIFLDN